MAIRLECIDFIVPVSLIKSKYPGGLEACLKDHAPLLGGRVWYDEHLFRDGAMSPGGIGSLVDEWTELGFEPVVTVDEVRSWKDVCVVESLFGGPTLDCDWIVVDGWIAYLSGTEPGEIVGREHFQET